MGRTPGGTTLPAEGVDPPWHRRVYRHLRDRTQARRVIHDNDVERLKQLLAEYPTLLSWQSNDRDGGLLGIRYELLR